MALPQIDHIQPRGGDFDQQAVLWITALQDPRAGLHMNSASVDSVPTKAIDIIEIIRTALPPSKNSTARRRLREGEVIPVIQCSVMKTSSAFL